jgi:shikimate dehydrogenase
MTDKYAVIGNPVAHSKSPLIHAEFARETGEDLSYVSIFARHAEFEAAVERFQKEGGRGMNVTLPFKHRAHALARIRSVRAGQALAVNTLTFESDGVHGDNTDGVGLVRDLTVNLGRVIRGTRILLMGAGGASYGVCGPLLDEAPAELTVANRTRAKALALCEHFRDVAQRPQVLSGCGYDELAGRHFDLIINATSASLAGDMPQLSTGVFAPAALAYDMVYGAATPFIAFASAQGAQCTDGLGMLVEQAAESFRIWRGMRPDTAPVIAMLRR